MIDALRVVFHPYTVPLAQKCGLDMSQLNKGCLLKRKSQELGNRKQKSQIELECNTLKCISRVYKNRSMALSATYWKILIVSRIYGVQSVHSILSKKASNLNFLTLMMS